VSKTGPVVSDKNGRMFVVDSELSQPEDVSVSSDGKSVVVADTGIYLLKYKVQEYYKPTKGLT